MTDLNLNTLPSREDLKRAIEPWWSGGGTTTLIVDICRERQATMVEAQNVAERLAAKLSNGLHFVSREVATDCLEEVRAVGRHVESKMRQPTTKDFDQGKCIFGDGVRCPNCGEVHGRMLLPGEFTSRIREVRELFEARQNEKLAETDWEQKKAEFRRMRMHGVCDGAGKDVVEIDGKLACPDCGVEVPDFVFRIPAKKRSGETA